ncbi:hypothetical protein BDV18DRAFT_147749 [Aspergillus unguis]
MYQDSTWSDTPGNSNGPLNFVWFEALALTMICYTAGYKAWQLVGLITGSHITEAQYFKIEEEIQKKVLVKAVSI